MFIPDYDSAPAPLDTHGNFCAQAEWGCWTASSIVVHEGYATAGGFNDQTVQYATGALQPWGTEVMPARSWTLGGVPAGFVLVGESEHNTVRRSGFQRP